MITRTHSIALVYASFILFSAACGSSDGSSPAPRPTTPLGNANNDSSTDSSKNKGSATELIETDLNEVIYTGQAVTIPLKLPSTFDETCTKNQATISWTIIGDESKVTIANPKTCRPSITLNPGFDSTNSVSALMQLSDSLVKYVAQLKVVNPSVCTASGGSPEGNLCVFVACNSADACGKLAMPNANRFVDGRNTVTRDYVTPNVTNLCSKYMAQSKVVDFKVVTQTYTPTYRFNSNYIIEANNGDFQMELLAMPNTGGPLDVAVLSNVRCSN